MFILPVCTGLQGWILYAFCKITACLCDLRCFVLGLARSLLCYASCCILLHCWISTPSTRAWPAIAGFDWQSLHISICSSCPFMCTPNAVNSLLVLNAMSLDCSYQLTLSETDDGLSQLCLMYCLGQFVRAIGIGRHWCRSEKYRDQDCRHPSMFTAFAGVAFLLTWQLMCTQSPACEWCGA